MAASSGAEAKVQHFSLTVAYADKAMPRSPKSMLVAAVAVRRRKASPVACSIGRPEASIASLSPCPRRWRTECSCPELNLANGVTVPPARVDQGGAA